MLGPRDALVVLGLRVLRRGTWLLFPVGACVALLAGVSEEGLSTRYDSVFEWLHALTSPLWLLAVAVLLRLAVAPVAYVASLSVAILGPRGVSRTTDDRSRWSRWGDLLRVAGGLRALRWTLAVRDEAVSRSGRRGRVLQVFEAVTGGLILLAWVGFAVLVARAT